MRIPLPEAFLRQPIAHRALHNRAKGRPENSRSAFRAAIRAGYAIETDLQLSADGVAMVFHDHDLDRLTEQSGPVHARSAADLGRIRLRDAKGCIPTLTEMLSIVAGQVPLLIELKEQRFSGGPGVGPLEAATAQALAAYAGPVAVMSFDPDSVAEMARLCPQIPRGITTGSYDPVSYAPFPPDLCEHLRDIPDADRVGASFISHEWRDLARPRVADLKAQGLAVLCWTVKGPKAEARAREIADNITFEGYRAPFSA